MALHGTSGTPVIALLGLTVIVQSQVIQLNDISPVGKLTYTPVSFVGPYNHIWGDDECSNVGNNPGKTLSECKELCKQTRDCTAFNYREDPADCVLRACGLPAPQPQTNYPPYHGYTMGIDNSTLIQLSQHNIIDHGGYASWGSGPEHLLTEKGIWNPDAKPWFVTFDFAKVYIVNKVKMINYADTTHDVTRFTIQVSDDNSKWTLLEDIDNVATGHSKQQYFSVSGDSRYWKLTVKSTGSVYQPWLKFFGFYGKITKPSTTTTMAPTTTTTEKSNPNNCEDESKHCAKLAAKGKCTKGGVFMKCKLSCACGIKYNPKCVDTKKNCPKLAAKGKCSKSNVYMRCRASCACDKTKTMG